MNVSLSLKLCNSFYFFLTEKHRNKRSGKKEKVKRERNAMDTSLRLPRVPMSLDLTGHSMYQSSRIRRALTHSLYWIFLRLHYFLGKIIGTEVVPVIVGRSGRDVLKYHTGQGHMCWKLLTHSLSLSLILTFQTLDASKKKVSLKQQTKLETCN